MSKTRKRKILFVRVFCALCAVSLFTLWLSFLNYPLPSWLLTLSKVLAFPTYPILAIRLAWEAFGTLTLPKLGIINRRDAPQVVAVEPWAEDFTLMPGEELEVVAFGDGAIPWFQVVEWEGISQVYCNDTDEFEVLQGGVRLECGHNRQPEPAA